MSVPTIASLATILGNQLSPANGRPAPRREISGVHVSELFDPGLYLAGGELLLTTGLSLRNDAGDIEHYVENLQNADVAALGFGLGPVFTELPSELVNACARAELPLLVVPAPTPFLTITRAYWSAVARSGEEVLLSELAAQRLLVDAATSTDPTRSVVQSLARVVDGWVAIVGPGDRVEAIYPEECEADARKARALVRGHADRGAGSIVTSEGRVSVFPFPGHSSALLVGTRGPLRIPLRRTTLTAFAMLTLACAGAHSGVSRAAAHADDIAALVALGESAAARALAIEWGMAPPPARAPLLIARTVDARALVDKARGAWPGALAGVRSTDVAWIYLGSSAGAEIPSAARALSAQAAWLMFDDVRVEAVRTTLDRAAALSEVADGEIRHPGTDTAASIRRVVRRLRSLPSLADTASAYLRCRGNWERTARELGVHRNTVRNRIDAIRRDLHLDLDDPDVAANLWIELRRVRETAEEARS